MKYAGLILILCASTLTGCLASAGLKQETARIRIMRQFLNTVCTELERTLPFIPDLLRDLAEQDAFSSLQFLHESAADADSFPDCWQRAIQKDEALTDAERQILSTVGQTLGSTTLNGQLSALALCQEQFRKLELEAEQTAQQRGALYRRFGVLAGCFVAIIFL